MNSDFTVVDVETSGDHPWIHQLVAVGIGSTVHKPEAGMREATKLLSDPNSVVVAHTNYDLRWLVLNGCPFVEGVRYHDTKVMAFMLDQSQELALDKLCQRYLGHEPLNKPIRQVQGRVMFQSQMLDALVPIEDVPWPEMEEYNRQDLAEIGRAHV